MTVEAQIRLGRRAKELLESEMFQEVAQHLREATIEQWRNTASGSVTLREQLYAEIHGLDALEARLRAWVDEGEHQAARVEKLNSRQA